MRISLILVLTLFLIGNLKATNYCMENLLAEQWKQLNSSYIRNQTTCCEVSSGQWEFMSWYFLRVGSFINVTEIVRASDPVRQTFYMSNFVKDLYSHMGLEYHTHHIDYKSEDEVRDEQKKPNSKSYIWHAEPSAHSNSSDFIKTGKLNIRSQILKKNWYREDEPDVGSIVLASNLEVIDHYVNGERRKPFTSTRTHYVIYIYRRINVNWDMMASSILSKLWKYYRISNVILMSSCQQKEVRIPSVFLIPFSFSSFLLIFFSIKIYELNLKIEFVSFISN